MCDCWYKEVCESYGENCQTLCVRYAEMKYLMEHSNLPVAKRKPQQLMVQEVDYIPYLRLDTIRKDIVNWVEEGKNLYIASHNMGNGKTSWAIKLMLRYFDQVWSGNGFRQRALFIHVPTFIMKCKDFNNLDREFEDLKRQVQEVDLVVWDDIGSTGITQYDYSNLLVAIDARVMAGKANIVTGNCTTRQELAQMIGAKLTSRLFGTETEIVEFKGGDMR